MSILQVNTIEPVSGDDINVNGQFTKLYTTGGTASAMTITLAPAPSALSEITRFSAKMVASNTGAFTIAPNGLAATDVKLLDGNDPHAGAVNTTGVFDFVNDGTNFVLLNPALLPETATPKIYSGYVGADGTTGNDLPSGWSASKLATGQYTVTHNLALTNAKDMAVVPSVFSTTAKFANLAAVDINSFSIYTYDTTGAASNPNSIFFTATIPARNQ